MDGIAPRPCPDPVDFINEIKLAKINLNRSPEDNKKLNVKQMRRLIKKKEKHLNKLGLQRTNQLTESEGSSDSDADEFVPATKIQVSARTGVTLRLRRPTPDTKHSEKKSSGESATSKRPTDDAQPPTMTTTTTTNERSEVNGTVSRTVKRKCENSLISSTKHKRHSDASRPVDVYRDDENKYNSRRSLDTDLICLCNKVSNYYTRKTLDTTHCRAIDEIDEEHIGCCNEVEGDILQLYRPSVRALYKASRMWVGQSFVSFFCFFLLQILCKDHRKRLAAHNSCAGCGIFLTQGRFVLCSKNHFFHRDCAIKYILNAPFDPHNNKLTCPTLLLKCPHCGNDAPMYETLVTMRCKNVPVFLPKQFNELAKMSIGSHTNESAPMPSSFAVDLENVIPVSINNLINKMKIKLNYSKSSMFTTKDFLYAVHGKAIAQLAEIIGACSTPKIDFFFQFFHSYTASGFDIGTPLPEFRNGTCLHLVSSFGDLTMAYLVLSRATSLNFLNIVDAELRTAIMCAVVGGKNDILKLLVQFGADVTAKARSPLSERTNPIFNNFHFAGCGRDDCLTFGRKER